MGKTDETERPESSNSANAFGVSARIILSATLAGLLVIGVGGWAAHAKLSGAVIASGSVVVPEQVKAIQHRDGGIVSEIAVANGDAVKKGSVLLRLDDTQTRVELAIIKSQLQQLTAMQARLIAERDDGAQIDFGEELPKSITSGEVKLFEQNRRMLSSQKDQLRLQAVQLDEQVRGFSAQRESNDQEGAIIDQELTKLDRLLKQGLVPIEKKRDLLRQKARLQGARGELAAKIAEALGRVSEINVKLLTIDHEVRKEAQTGILQVDAKLAELRERSIAAADRLARMDVRAPVDGFVYDLQIHTLGGIIASGATVMSIVPQTDKLKVEIRIPPVDIDRIAVGQPARLRFTSFNQRTTPELPGNVEIVAAATTVDRATGQPYYMASIALHDLGMLKGNKLMPGMPVEVFVQTDDRTALSYFAKPFTDQMMKAFREE
ncbi:HlyD family secretion protein [Rhizobium tibeticum]|uniref:Membrane fusion protein (MFP) family protein n=1 Tax=Rhizobium tibeticum TaxID=501024 RepID=A0A1H8UGY3_9HYPH|nr:HlyD family type I secretion periplasmic adaptor subunit [Rhizobium tibeticum]SEI17425.1 Type I secretion system membrane fusion protein PrsE [Rhizobium tibeticum]SEP02356.1 HlyD family secretion protein [Rhizobium tibeticum]